MPYDLVDGLAATGMVMATVGAPTAEFSSVTVDTWPRARLVVRHLISLGHRRIGIISGQAEMPIHFDVPDLRIRGVRAALAEAGILSGPTHVQHAGFTVLGGYRAMRRILDEGLPPTAVFAFSDEMAIGAIHAAAGERGCASPRISRWPGSTTTTWRGHWA